MSLNNRLLVLGLVLVSAGCGGAYDVLSPEEAPRSQEPNGLFTIELRSTSTWSELQEALVAAGHETGTPIRISMGATEITARTGHLTSDHFRNDPFVPAIGLTEQGILATTEVGYLPPACNGTVYYEPEHWIAERGPDGYDMDALRSCFRSQFIRFGSVYIASIPGVTLGEIYTVIEAAETMDPIIAFETPCWFESLPDCHEATGARDPLRDLLNERSDAFEACQVDATQRNVSLPERLIVYVTVYPTRSSRCEVSAPDIPGQVDRQLASCIRQVACDFGHTFDYTAYAAHVLPSPPPSE